MAKNKVLILGATGVVGNGALEHFAGEPDWDVVAVSRRVPECVSGPFEHLKVDLQDQAQCEAAFSKLTDITHVIYAALFELPGLMPGWQETEQMDTNLRMLQNTMEPLRKAAKNLQHVSLLQGTKAYGVHIRPMKSPARERWPRDDHENFYWLQEDYLKEIQQASKRSWSKGGNWSWTIFRPQLVVGYSYGTAMNLIPIIGAYAAICKEEGRPMGFPGGPDMVMEAVDARLLARAFHWAGVSPQCANQHFNMTNGDIMIWRNVWPAICDALGVEPGPDEDIQLNTWLLEKAAVWDRVVEKHNLRPITMEELVGESHHYADFFFLHGYEGPAPVFVVSTIKARQFGFPDCIDTEDMFRYWFALFQERKILPPR